MKTVLISWGFDTNKGNIYLDAYMDLTDPKFSPKDVKMLDFRVQFQQVHLALLKIPKECERDYIQEYFKEYKQENLVDLLKSAKVRSEDIVRKKLHENNAIDFLKSER